MSEIENEICSNCKTNEHAKYEYIILGSTLKMHYKFNKSFAGNMNYLEKSISQGNIWKCGLLLQQLIEKYGSNNIFINAAIDLICAFKSNGTHVTPIINFWRNLSSSIRYSNSNVTLSSMLITNTKLLVLIVC